MMTAEERKRLESEIEAACNNLKIIKSYFEGVVKSLEENKEE